MIEAIIFTIVLFAFGFLLCRLGEHCRCAPYDYTCRCGNLRLREPRVVDAIDPTSIVDALSALCPICQAKDSVCGTGFQPVEKRLPHSACGTGLQPVERLVGGSYAAC